MSNGLLGKVVSVDSVITPVYTVPANVQFSTVSIRLLNTATTDASVDVFVSTSANPSLVDKIESGVIIPMNSGVYEETCFLMSPGETLSFKANNSLVVARAYGLEQL
jgi:hypothetical protein